MPGAAGAPTSLRLFLALWPGAPVRRALAARRDGVAWPPGAAPVPDAKLHLTLHFLGSVPAARSAEIAAGLALPMRPFELCLDAAEHWPGGLFVLRPRVLAPPLRRLHADLAAALRGLALPVEARAYRPHVTLARRAGAGACRSAAPVRWAVAGYALVHSTPEGRYLLLRRYRSDARQAQRDRAGCPQA